jgi:hypothetical protein
MERIYKDNPKLKYGAYSINKQLLSDPPSRDPFQDPGKVLSNMKSPMMQRLEKRGGDWSNVDLTGRGGWEEIERDIYESSGGVSPVRQRDTAKSTGQRFDSLSAIGGDQGVDQRVVNNITIVMDGKVIAQHLNAKPDAPEKGNTATTSSRGPVK